MFDVYIFPSDDNDFSLWRYIHAGVLIPWVAGAANPLAGRRLLISAPFDLVFILVYTHSSPTPRRLKS
ncbi:hypothetical protein HDK77DRAFT_492314, partial [Phyllosticta capitalensis]